MPTLVYDGDCGFCRRCVAWVRKRDRRGITFVAYQHARLPEGLAKRAPTSIIWMANRDHVESSAAVRVLWSLHLGWKLAAAGLWLVPKPLRDLGYRWAGRRWGPLPSR